MEIHLGKYIPGSVLVGTLGVVVKTQVNGVVVPLDGVGVVSQ